MSILKWNKNSLFSFFTNFTIVIILIQTALLTSMLVFGGVFKQAKLNSYKAFNEKVSNRSNYLRQEMRNRWTNLDPYSSKISEKVSQSEDMGIDFFDSIKDDLIDMLRSTSATGAFVILNELDSEKGAHPALYFRDYDPMSNPPTNEDIYMVCGPVEISRKYKFALDSDWQYNLTLTEENKAFFTKPYENALNSTPYLYDSLGYWSPAFNLSQNDLPIITYSMPLSDNEGNVVGVVGIELTVNNFMKFLPASDLQPRRSLGYIVATTDSKNENLKPMIVTSNTQKRFLDESEPLFLKEVDSNNSIYTLRNIDIKDEIYASVIRLNLYFHNSPFQNEEWYIVGFMYADSLLSYVNRIEYILKFSIIISLILGVFSGIIASRQMSKPIRRLLSEIRKSDKSKTLSLSSTGLLEIDELSNAIVQANKLMLSSASRLSRVIELVDLPIAAFEVNDQYEKILVSGKLFEILSCPESDYDSFMYKDNFFNLLKTIMSNPEPDEEDTFRILYPHPKWVRIKINRSEGQVNGIVQDVTEEILDKKKIKEDRDIDSLTKLLNGKSFQSNFNKWYSNKPKGEAALVMFDLDFLKSINDTYGHKWGDYYIIETAKQLSNIAPKTNSLVGRRSGDEFLALLHGFDNRDSIRAQISEFYSNLSKHKLSFPDGNMRSIKVSSGFVWIEDFEISYDILLHNADKALYHSKKNNKGYFTEESISDRHKI